MSKTVERIRLFVEVIKVSSKEFFGHNPARMGAALSYFALFSFVPMIFFFEQLAELIYGQEVVLKVVYSEAQGIADQNLAELLIESVSNVSILFEKSWFMTIISVLVLLFSSTSLFNAFRKSLHDLWDLKTVQKAVFKTIVSRLSSLFMVVALGIVLVAFFAVDSIAYKIMEAIFESHGSPITRVIEESIVFLFNILFFMVFFIVLTLAIIPKKTLVYGGVFTGIVFHVSNHILAFFFDFSSFTKLYGLLGSIMLLMLWVFILSQVVLFGAKVMSVYGEKSGNKIIARSNKFLGSKVVD